MNLSDIKSLYAYNRWANDRMFAAIEKVPNEKFGAPIVSSFPSLRETTFHILFAEWLWLNRWQGVSPCTSVVDSDASPATWDALSPGKKPKWQELSTVAAMKSFA
ncbi:MAG: DinB family protein [Acidobacteriota bacterium]|nr:DinB family protein [Acidobacteriota bacterium]